MRIKLYWLDCNYINRQWVDKGIDSYWVECTLEEAEKYIFPYLSANKIEESKHNLDQKHSKSINNEANLLYYLESKDLCSVVSSKWYYPYAGQWNGYSPFIEMNVVEIKELSEICRL